VWYAQQHQHCPAKSNREVKSNPVEIEFS